MMDKRTTLVLASMFLLPFATQSDVVGVDYGELLDVTVTNDVTFAGRLWYAERARRIEKGGAATETLPVASIASRHGATFAVREGGLRLTAGTPEELTEPTNILNRAAFWLDANRADTLVEGSNDFSAGVARWYDVRETCVDDTWSQNHYCAAAKTSFITNEVSEGVWEKTIRYPVVKTYADRPGLTYVDFNGRKSGTWMRFLTKARADLGQIEKIQHVFVAGYVTNAWGYVLGANGGYGIYWHPHGTQGQTEVNYADVNSCSPAMMAGVSTLNGAEFKPEATTVRKGPYVYQWDAAQSAAYFGNLFNDRGIWSAANGWRCGGDSVGELVVFTNRLSVAEREEVGEWLLRKWVKAHVPGMVKVKTAPGTTVSVAAGVSATVSGNGTIVAESEGATTGYSQTEPYAGRTHVAAAAQKIKAAEPTLALAAGESLAITRDNYDNFNVARTVDAAKADAGETALSLATNTAVRVTDLPDAVKRLAVSGSGELILSAPRPTTELVPDAGELYATMPNADFEEWTGNTSVSGFGTAGTTYYHWKLEQCKTTDYFINLAFCRTHSGHWMIDGGTRANFRYEDYPFQGNVVMVLKQNAIVSNQATFPADGDYELTFLTGGRLDGAVDQYAGGFARLSLVDAQGVTNEIGTALGYVCVSTTHQRFLVRGVRAGTYKFVIDHCVGSGDAHTIFDDFRFRRVTDVSTETIVRPPDPDFECAEMNYADRRIRSKNHSLRHWTFTYGDPSLPDVFLVTRGMTSPNLTPQIGFRRGAERGGIQLAFFGNAGSATSESFTLPAGTWKLRCKRGSFTYSEGNACYWNGKNTAAQTSVQGALVVGDTEHSFGTTSVAWLPVLASTTLPTAVTVTEPTTVRLKLKGGVSGQACAIVDEVELVRQDTNTLITNGTFPDGTGWTFRSNKDGTEFTSKSVSGVGDPCRDAGFPGQFPYGTAYGVGNRALDICQCASAEQSVTFPAAGAYRLEFSARSRLWYANASATEPNRTWAGNAARFYLVDAQQSTNVFYVTQPICASNFLFRAALFDVPAAGTYTFGIQGLNGLPLEGGAHLKVATGATDNEFFIDQVAITPAVDEELDLAEGLALDLSGTAKLRLDFTGTNEIDRLRLGGVSVAGYVDASHRSGLVLGTGCLYIRPKGTVLLFR